MRRLLILVILVCAGCAPPAERAPTPRPRLPLDKNDASGVYMVGGKPVLWPRARLPVTFSFVKGTPPGIQTACRNAAATFNAVADRTLILFSQAEIVAPKDFDGSHGLNTISYGLRPPEKKDEVGVAGVIYGGTQIFEAHIDFNPAMLPAAGGWWWDANAESACLHEVGHALGFTHRDDPTSIMYPREQLHLKRLSADDRARLRRYYGPEAR